MLAFMPQAALSWPRIILSFCHSMSRRFPSQPVSSYPAQGLRVDAPIRGKSGATGVLSLGFGLGDLEREVHENRMTVMGVSVLVFVVGLAVSFLVGTVLVRPIQQMTDISLRIAAGDLSQGALHVTSGDEVGRMATAFDRMLRSLRELSASADRVAQGDLVGRLAMDGPVAEAFNRMVEGQRTIVGQIGETSVQLATAASEIYASAQEQQATATQQSASVEEVSQTMQSLLQSAAHIAESARGVLANAERTRETTDGISKRFAELTGHTNRIAELLEVIREIADRSDLLALNASLEATRAGEAGRPFSLVAAEMRRLAERVTASVAGREGAGLRCPSLRIVDDHVRGRGAEARRKYDRISSADHARHAATAQRHGAGITGDARHQLGPYTIGVRGDADPSLDRSPEGASREPRRNRRPFSSGHCLPTRTPRLSDRRQAIAARFRAGAGAGLSEKLGEIGEAVKSISTGREGSSNGSAYGAPIPRCLSG